MAAFYGEEIDNVDVEINAPEVPIMCVERWAFRKDIPYSHLIFLLVSVVHDQSPHNQYNLQVGLFLMLLYLTFLLWMDYI